MKRLASMALLTASFIVTLTATSAYAQIGSNGHEADIPFAFEVGGKMLEAGRYTIKPNSFGSAVLQIRSTDGKQGVMVSSYVAQGKADKSRPAKLVFNKYGDQYFLQSAWTGSDGSIIQRSKRERLVRKEMAATRGVAEVVEIAAVNR